MNRPRHLTVRCGLARPRDHAPDQSREDCSEDVDSKDFHTQPLPTAPRRLIAHHLGLPAVTLSPADLVTPSKAAEIVTVVEAVTRLVETVNVALVAPTATVT